MRRLLLALLLVPLPAAAEEGVCRIVELDFLPAQLASTTAAHVADSQIVAWIEDPNGTYVDTVFITEETGTFGLGNRPGRFDFNSGPLWPYGRRITVFPVWAHRHGLAFDEVVFQDGDDNNLSHAFGESSVERHYCRPLIPNELMWDAGSCATKAFTDKGVLSSSRDSKYPPRNDVLRASEDHSSVAMFAMLNPFDAVSRPTPVSGVPATLMWLAPDTVPTGNYVLWIEVSREFDHNATYSTSARPSPAGIPWSEYGAPYRGQPSVVWKVPFTIDPANRTVAYTIDYAGYGDPDGATGALRPPDATITTGVQGSGAERLAMQSDGGTPYRLRVGARTELDPIKPAAPLDVSAEVSMTTANIAFTAPGDDDQTGKVTRYEIRYLAGGLDAATFETGLEVRPDMNLVAGGDLQEFSITGLLGATEYTVGIRAIDDCSNRGPITFHTFTTSDRGTGEVPWCFVATAAYGSSMANDVDMLRHVRDAFLSKTVLGELAVEAYYTFSPAVSGVISESDVLRASARAVLDPIVRWVRAFRF